MNTLAPTPLRSGCGIAGAVGCALSPDVLGAMTDALAHRGPDDRGLWQSVDGRVQFGHRRLSIVGVDARGHQPMTRGPLTLNCNGEIFNYGSLRRELESRGYTFTSACDVEVILHAYAEWGVDGLARLNGIFALALHDAHAGLVMLARDPLGIKPLVVADAPSGGLLFASEARALLQCPQLPRRPNLDAVRADVLQDLLAPRHDTWFSGIRNLEPGHALVVDVRSGSRREFAGWQPPGSSAQARSVAQVVEELRETFDSAVRLQLLSDVGVAATLSGGMDSTAVVTTILRHRDEPLDVFAVQYAGSGEQSADQEDLRHARLLARAEPRLRLHEVTVQPHEAVTRETLDAVVSAFDGSMAIDFRTLGAYELYRHIHAHGVKVVLTGQGADELWMGYYGHPMHPFWDYGAAQLTPAALTDRFFLPHVPLGLPAWNPDFLDEAQARRCILSSLAVNYRDREGDDEIQRLSRWILRTHLRALLNVDDRVAMAHSVEARLPWLDVRMAELSLSTPGRWKIAGPGSSRQTKALLREALRDRVPALVLDRRKASFPAPPPSFAAALQALMREDAGMIGRSAFLQGLFAPGTVERLIGQPQPHPQALLLVHVLWRFGQLNGF